MADQPSARPPRLFVIGRSYGQAHLFAVDEQLMPGWVFVRALDTMRGPHDPRVVFLPGWRARFTSELENLLASRRAVVVTDLAPWRRPGTEHVSAGCEWCAAAGLHDPAGFLDPGTRPERVI